MVVIFETGSAKWVFEMAGDLRYTSNRQQAKTFINEVEARKYVSRDRYLTRLLTTGCLEFQSI